MFVTNKKNSEHNSVNDKMLSGRFGLCHKQKNGAMVFTITYYIYNIVQSHRYLLLYCRQSKTLI